MMNETHTFFTYWSWRPAIQTATNVPWFRERRSQSRDTWPAPLPALPHDPARPRCSCCRRQAAAGYKTDTGTHAATASHFTCLSIYIIFLAFHFPFDCSREGVTTADHLFPSVVLSITLSRPSSTCLPVITALINLLFGLSLFLVAGTPIYHSISDISAHAQAILISTISLRGKLNNFITILCHLSRKRGHPSSVPFRFSLLVFRFDVNVS